MRRFQNKYKTPILNSDYAKNLTKKNTENLESELAQLESHLKSMGTVESPKKQSRSNSAKARENNNDNKPSPPRWGSAGKDNLRQRRLKKQSFDILGKTVDLDAYKKVKILKPSPPKVSKEEPKEVKEEDVSNFSLVNVCINDEVYEFETETDGTLALSTIQRYLPDAVGLCYMNNNRVKRVLPITPDGNFVKPPRGLHAWDTAREYLPVQPQAIRVAMTPRVESNVPKNAGDGNDILNGSYDEERNRKEFQDAVMAFRNAGKAEQEEVDRPVSRASVQTDVQDLDVKFQPNMSFFDRLCLEKLRKSESSQNVMTSENIQTDNETQKVLDEIERERKEIREMLMFESQQNPVELTDESSTRTVTPETSPVKKTTASITLSDISKMELDIDVLQVQKSLQSYNINIRPSTAQRKNSGLSRPVTPAGH